MRLKIFSDSELCQPILNKTIRKDTQVHATQCQIANKKIEMTGKYSDIFREKVPTDIAKTLLKISQLREDYI